MQQNSPDLQFEILTKMAEHMANQRQDRLEDTLGPDEIMQELIKFSEEQVSQHQDHQQDEDEVDSDSTPDEDVYNAALEAAAE